MHRDAVGEPRMSLPCKARLGIAPNSRWDEPPADETGARRSRIRNRLVNRIRWFVLGRFIRQLGGAWRTGVRCSRGVQSMVQVWMPHDGGAPGRGAYENSRYASIRAEVVIRIIVLSRAGYRCRRMRQSQVRSRKDKREKREKWR